METRRTNADEHMLTNTETHIDSLTGMHIHAYTHINGKEAWTLKGIGSIDGQDMALARWATVTVGCVGCVGWLCLCFMFVVFGVCLVSMVGLAVFDGSTLLSMPEIINVQEALNKSEET